MNANPLGPDSPSDAVGIGVELSSTELRLDDVLLIRVSGPDTPGITTELMITLSEVDAQIQDLEQVLLRGHLTLAAVIATPLHPDALVQALDQCAIRRGIERRVGELAVEFNLLGL